MTWTIKIKYLSLDSLTITFIFSYVLAHSNAYMYGFTYRMQWSGTIYNSN